MQRPAWARPVVTIDAPTDGTDATRTIREQINAAPDGAVIRFPVGQSRGRYRVDRSLVFGNRRGLLVEGPAPDDPAVLWTDLIVHPERDPWAFTMASGHKTKKSLRLHLRFSESSDLHLRWLRIEGPNSFRNEAGYTQLQGTWEPEHAFSFPACDGVLLEGCSALSVYGDGLQLLSTGGRPAVSNLEARDCEFVACGRTGVSLDKCENIRLHNIVTRSVGVHGVGNEPHGDGWGARNIEISHCSFDSRRSPLSVHGSKPTTDLWVHDCVFESSEGKAPVFQMNDNGDHVERRARFTFERNISRYSTFSGFELNKLDGAIVRDNKFILGPDRVGVRIINSTGVQLIDNNFGSAGAPYEVVGYAAPDVEAGNTWGTGSSEPLPDSTAGDDGPEPTVAPEPDGAETTVPADGAPAAPADGDTSDTTASTVASKASSRQARGRRDGEHPGTRSDSSFGQAGRLGVLGPDFERRIGQLHDPAGKPTGGLSSGLLLASAGLFGFTSFLKRRSALAGAAETSAPGPREIDRSEAFERPDDA